MVQSKQPRRLGTVAEGAAQARCHERTIRRHIAAGDLTGYRLGKRILRVDLDELDSLMRPIPTAKLG